jgi:F-type H+-transporting ATPase subunit gamma
MASLKEIKGRIASVSGTLKITSAMKLVASAKLRKAQLAITNMLPYQRQLQRILSSLMAEGAEEHAAGDASVPRLNSAAAEREWMRPGAGGATATSVAIVAFSSNSSLCGAFNSNAIRQTLSVIDEYRSAGFTDENIIVYSVGRKIAEAMRKAGFQSPEDYSKMAESPGYEAASALAKELIEGHLSGRFVKVELVYNHFKSTSSQPTVRETYLSSANSPGLQTADYQSQPGQPSSVATQAPSDDIIVEPSREAVLGVLLPKVLRLKIYATLLDSNAAEHAARTVAMQTATDNGNDLLEELTLEYNKGRQQKITSEILDIVGGSLR